MTEQDKDRPNPTDEFKDATTKSPKYPPEIEAERQRLLARERRMHEWLDMIPPNDLAYSIGQKVCRQMQRHDRQRLAHMARAWSNAQITEQASHELDKLPLSTDGGCGFYRSLLRQGLGHLFELSRM
jgi:hypothetical protein